MHRIWIIKLQALLDLQQIYCNNSMANDQKYGWNVLHKVNLADPSALGTSSHYLLIAFWRAIRGVNTKNLYLEEFKVDKVALRPCTHWSDRFKVIRHYWKH